MDQNRRNETKHSNLAAYFLAVIGLGLMLGILIKLIDPTPVSVTVTLDGGQLEELKDQIKIIRGSLGSLETYLCGIYKGMPGSRSLAGC